MDKNGVDEDEDEEETEDAEGDVGKEEAEDGLDGISNEGNEGEEKLENLKENLDKDDDTLGEAEQWSDNLEHGHVNLDTWKVCDTLPYIEPSVIVISLCFQWFVRIYTKATNNKSHKAELIHVHKS